MQTYKPLVCIPCYNHGSTLRKVLEGCLVTGYDIVVINDGSTDNTSAVLSEFSEKIKVITNPINMGKGASLTKALNAAREWQYSHLVTLDADGQHYPEDIPGVINKSKTFPDKIILGCRKFTGVNGKPMESIPNSSRFGRWFSNLWIFLETGERLIDTQSGFRVYPVEPLAQTFIRTTGYDFEVEILVKARWQGIKIDQYPVKVFYPLDSRKRISHFHQVKDNFRLTKLHSRLFCQYWLYRKWAS